MMISIQGYQALSPHFSPLRTYFGQVFPVEELKGRALSLVIIHIIRSLQNCAFSETDSNITCLIVANSKL